MQRAKWISGVSLCAIAMMTAGVAQGAPQGAGVFFGVSGGEVTYDQEQRDYGFIVQEAFFDNGLILQTQSSSFDDSDSQFAVFGGYRFNRYIAVEAGYVDLGEVTYTSAGLFRLGFFGTIAGNLKVTAGARGGYVSALGSLPIVPAWEVYGRAGFLVERTEVEVTGTFGTVTTTAEESTDGVDSILGVGTAVHFGEHVSLRAEYQRFIAIDDDYYEDTAETNADVFSLGVVVRF
jgi:OmpA-OmpF porin, OOP family